MNNVSFIKGIEYSDWQCYLFGGQPQGGLCWRPIAGKVPNRFWRWMQYLCFGNRWVKIK